MTFNNDFKPVQEALPLPELNAIDEDERLALAMKARDEVAFRRVWTKYGRWVYQRIFRILKNHDDTEEICHDTFFKVWQKIDRFDPGGGKLQSWIGTVARNAAIDRLRQQNRRLEWEILPQEDSQAFIECCPTADEPLEELQAKELQQILEEELNRLTNPKHQMAWTLRHKDGLSIREIAEKMGGPEGSVKIWIFRATKVLATRLQQRGWRI
jgi:RNA polymerase sigma factor (sigma-70 family)